MNKTIKQTGIEGRLAAMTNDFVNSIVTAFRETFAQVVGGIGPSLAPNGKTAHVSAAAPGRISAGRRRPPSETEAVAKKVAAFVNSQPNGARVDVIGKQLGMSTAELMLPIAKALTSKLMGRRGERRATTYMPLKKPAKAAPKAKAS